MRTRFFYNAGLVLLGFLLTPVVWADGLTSVKSFYQNTHSMRAEFHQIVTDKQGRTVQDVHGEMQLKRPNKFRWDYRKPFEQQIMSDGQQVWLYDIDLAQVTIQPLSKVLGSSPAALLAGGVAIEDNFKLVNAARKSDLEWVSAQAKDKDSGFEKILLGFKAGKLQEMALIDNFGHQTQIIFTQSVNNPTIADKDFLFKIPKGVDVMGE